MDIIKEKNKKLIDSGGVDYSSNVMAKGKGICNKRNLLFYLSVVLLDIVIIVLFWCVFGNKNGVVGISDIVYGFNFNGLCFILSIVFFILLLNIFIDYCVLYSKSRQKKFWILVDANIKNNFYNRVTVYSKGLFVYAYNLNGGGVNSKIATDNAYNKKIMEILSTLLYIFVILIVGCVFRFKSVPVWVFVIGLLLFVCYVFFVMFVLYFDKFKNRYVSIIGKITTVLFKIKIIKNYDRFYNTLIEKLVVYNSALKISKIAIVSRIVIGVITSFVRHFILFLILWLLCGLNFNVLIEVLFKCVLLDLIINALPLNGGVVIYELLFVLLFGQVFDPGYVLYGLILFRFFDYYIYVLLFLILKFVKLLLKEKTTLNKI